MKVVGIGGSLRGLFLCENFPADWGQALTNVPFTTVLSWESQRTSSSAPGSTTTGTQPAVGILCPIRRRSATFHTYSETGFGALLTLYKVGVQEGDILPSEAHCVTWILYFLSMSLAIGVWKGILFQGSDRIADKRSRYI